MFLFFLRRIVSFQIQENGTVSVFFLIRGKQADEVSLYENKLIITLDSSSISIREDQFPDLFRLVKYGQFANKPGRLILDHSNLPEVLDIFSGTSFRVERAGLKAEYTLNFDEKATCGSFLDFEPNRGVMRVPTIKLSRGGISRNPPGVNTIHFDEAESYQGGWLLWKPHSAFIRIPEAIKSKYFLGNVDRLSAKNSFELLDHSTTDESISYSDRFKNARASHVEWATRFEFTADGLVGRPVFVDANRPDEFIEPSILQNRAVDGFAVVENGIVSLPSSVPRKLVNALKNEGLKKTEKGYLCSDIIKIPPLIRRMKRIQYLDGHHILLADDISDLHFSSHGVEPIISVRLDEGKDLIYLDEQYYLGKQRIADGLVEESLRQKKNFIQLGTQVIGFDRKKLSALAEKIKKKKELPIGNFYELFEISRGLKKPIFHQTFLEFFKKLSEPGKLPSVLPPKEFLNVAYSPKAYQRTGTNWMSFLGSKGLSGILADDMGLGKTYQALLAITSSSQFNTGCNLIICPKSLVENWRSEILKFLNLTEESILIHYGGRREEIIRSLECGGKFIITTYDTARNDADMLRGINFHYLVLDEAQKIKNPDAKTTKTLKTFSALHRITLTGTPLENRLSELWSIFDFLMPGYLGSRREFIRRFERPIMRQDDKEAQRELNVLVQPFILRRTVDQVLKLPGKNEWKKNCDLYNEQVAIYNRLLKESEPLIRRWREEENGKPNVALLALMQKLRMTCSHPDLITKTHQDGERSGKMEMLFQVLEDVLAGKKNKVLIFIEFLGNRRFIKEWLVRMKVRYVEMFGETSMMRRKEAIQKFNDGDAQVFLLGLKVGGVGLNLTAANYVIVFDRWWNPAVEAQAMARAYRIGQERRVTIYRFVTVGSIEERLEELHDKKRELFSKVVSEKAMMTGLSKDDILRLLNPPGIHSRVGH